MTSPLASIDARFSDPEATATPWGETQRALEAAELFWITTIRADGRPHMSPLVAVWLDDAIHFCTGEAEQKAMNLRVNRHVTLTTGCNTWTDGLDVMVEGEAVAVTDGASLSRLETQWPNKWDGRWRYQVRDGGFDHALVFAVAPVKVLAFGKGTFTQTTHRF
jgi:general stress protein 26